MPGADVFTFALRSTDAGLTTRDDHRGVPRTLLAAVATAAALAASASAAGGPFGSISSLPAGWSHAQINVVIRKQPHTLTYDRGRVVSVTPALLILRERDGSMAQITVSASTQVTIAGRPATLAQIRPNEMAIAVSVDGGPASAVRVTIPPGMAARLARRGAGK
jgi:hypothetical protein